MIGRITLTVIASMAMALMAGPPVRAQTSYTIQEIPALGSGGSRAHAINASGMVTGFSNSPGGSFHAFIWNPGTPGSITDLGAVSSTLTATLGFAINATGSVAGVGQGVNTYNHAVLYSGGKWLDLVGGGKFRETEAFGINDKVQVVGADWSQKSAFLSTVVAGKRQLVYISPGYKSGRAINTLGQVLVMEGPGNGCALWSPSTANGTSGSLMSLSMAIGGFPLGSLNDKGQVAVGRTLYLPAADYGLAAGYTDIGALPGPYPQYDTITAFGLNNLGQVCGVQESITAIYPDGSFTSSMRAFIWDAVNGIRDLGLLLDPVTGAGWTIPFGGFSGPKPNDMAINDAGKIVGTGLHNGRERGYVLTPR